LLICIYLNSNMEWKILTNIRKKIYRCLSERKLFQTETAKWNETYTSYAKYPDHKWLETSKNMVLEKFGVDQLNRPREKKRSIA